jgi:hypothetical protein
MSIYRPEIKMYYGSIDSDHRLIPVPDITISIEYNYSNDTIIGYTYIFNINGSATALDLRELNYGDEYPTETENYNIGSVVDHIHKLRNILSQNGNKLSIINGQTNATILEARGGTLRSFNFDESNNNWTQYASYSASLEFNSVDFMDSIEGCDTIFLDTEGFPKNQPGIVDIDKFKLKSFNDSWSFTFNENESYSRVQLIDNGFNLNINNHSFNIQYSIDAVGKHFYIEEDGVSKTIPAWEQAKNFVQYRLYHQVTNLLNHVLKNPYSSCASSDGLNEINIPGSGVTGLLSSLGDTNYKIYNEEITCESSESEGSFSATYSAIVSTTLGSNTFSDNAAIHTINKSIQTTVDDSGKQTNTISINGTINGLIEGGLIKINKVIQLPDKGSINLLSNISDTKYDNAKKVLDKIYSDSDYNSGIGDTGKRDLKPIFKSILGITPSALSITNNQLTSSCPKIPDPPHPDSFNLTHDYSGGNITYSVEYNSNNCIDGGNLKFNQVNIQTNKPTKIIATFNIPNGDGCPVIQELGTYTNTTVSVTISGTDYSCKGKPGVVDFTKLIECGACDDGGYFPVELPPDGDYIITQKQYTSNPVDGSYTINLGYICGTTGCILPKLNG